MEETPNRKEIGNALSNLEKLPKRCFGRSGTSVVNITAGEMGYQRITNQEWPIVMSERKGITLNDFIDELNHYEGISKAERQAMEFGSMFGWGLKLANPSMYNEDGTLNRQKLEETFNTFVK